MLYTYYEKYKKKYSDLQKHHDEVEARIKNYKEQIKKYDDLITKQESITNLKYHKTFDFTKGVTKKFFGLFKSGNKYMITMLCANMETTHFMIQTTEKYFIYEDGIYIIVPEFGKRNREAGIVEVSYTQGIALPLELNFDTQKIKDELNINQADVEMSIDPIILKRYTDGNFVEKVLKGDKLESDISLMRILTIISICINLGVLILVLSQVV